MKNILLIATLLLCGIVAAPASALTADDHGDWYADFDEAVAVAKEQGKDLFVDFTGSDWCVWCIKLHEEVFDHDSFLEPAHEEFVLVALDFPNAEEIKAKVPNPERNAELQAKYGIQGFPTCLLMNTDGVVFARMGYQPGGPEQYITDMREATTKGKALLVELEKLEAAYAAAEDKTPVVTRAIAMLADMDGRSPGVSIVVEIASEGLVLDPDNEAGMKLDAIKALLASGQADADVLAAARAMDSDNQQGLLEQSVEMQVQGVNSAETALAAVEAIEALMELEVIHDVVSVKSMAATAALWCEGPLEDHDRAVVLANQALAMEGEINERMQEQLDTIVG
jgi:thioredoxin-related protein